MIRRQFALSKRKQLPGQSAAVSKPLMVAAVARNQTPYRRPSTATTWEAEGEKQRKRRGRGETGRKERTLSRSSRIQAGQWRGFWRQYQASGGSG